VLFKIAYLLGIKFKQCINIVHITGFVFGVYQAAIQHFKNDGLSFKGRRMEGI
jgi:hypothetical protein